MLSNDAPPPLGGFGSPPDGFGPPPAEPPPPISRSAVAALGLGVLTIPGCMCGWGGLALSGLGLAFGAHALRQSGTRANFRVAATAIVLNALPLLAVVSFFGFRIVQLAARLLHFTL
jgi:hypothetical protein